MIRMGGVSLQIIANHPPIYSLTSRNIVLPKQMVGNKWKNQKNY